MRQFLERLHETQIYPRRVRRLQRLLIEVLPQEGRVIDVGCGDGLLTSLLARQHPKATFEGVDVLVRPRCHVPVKVFDGSRLPYGDATVDTALFVDVLHHTPDPMVLLREARRVARSIVIKDHLRDGWLAGPTLRFMDWVGNARHRVALPHVYWTIRQWHAAFDALGLRVMTWAPALRLYPWPASLVFDRSLHFIARLDRMRKLP